MNVKSITIPSMVEKVTWNKGKLCDMDIFLPVLRNRSANCTLPILSYTMLKCSVHSRKP